MGLIPPKRAGARAAAPEPVTVLTVTTAVAAGAAVTLTGVLIFAGLFPRIAAALVPFLPLA